MKIKLQKKTTKLVKSRWYTDCSDLPLFNFIKIVVNAENLRKYLTIAGMPTDAELQKAWDNISEEYNSQMVDTTQQYLLDLMVSIATADNRLAIVYNIVQYLSMRRSEGLIKLLQEELYFPYEYSEQSMEADLKATLSQAKAEHVDLQLSKNELTEYKEKVKPPTEDDYYSIISVLSKHQGYQIKAKKTSVTEFVSILNHFKNVNTKNTQNTPETE